MDDEECMEVGSEANILIDQDKNDIQNGEGIKDKINLKEEANEGKFDSASQLLQKSHS